MPGRDYAFYPKSTDQETLEEIIKSCGRGDYLEHEVNTLRDQVKWLAEYLLRKHTGGISI